MPRRVQICSCCGRKLVDYKHNLNQLLIRDLEMLYKAGGVSSLKNLSDLFEMTLSESNNFQKLRYFGLVEKVEPGVYGITELGKGFIEGRMSAPSFVITRNAIVLEDGPHIFKDGVEDYVQTKEDYQEQAERE